MVVNILSFAEVEFVDRLCQIFLGNQSMEIIKTDNTFFVET